MTAPYEGTHVRAQIPLKDASVRPQHNTAQEMSVITLDGSVEAPPPSSQPLPPQPRSRRPDQAINIVLADDNDITRRGLYSLLEAQPGFSVVGEIDRGTEVVETVKRLRPEVLVLDLVMPELGGLEITGQIAQQCPQTRILILSPYHEEAYFLEAFRRGATGYILKNTSVDDLTQAVREVVADRRYLSPSLSDRAIESYIDIQRIQKDPTLDAYGTLTNREREVLHLVLDGHTNAAIAEQLVISPRTAETHRANMMRKIGVANYRELLRYAMRRGIISIDD
jgi:DNA-binding NarL/FixJ family response regulator